jgi:dCMP deaminase
MSTYYNLVPVLKPSDWTWHQRFIKLAKEYSTWSKDPSTQVGAVAIDPNTRRVLSGGYNGFPRGIEDTDERLNDRDLKHSLVVHAEMNLIYNATRSGISLEGSHLYVWGLPVCSECAKGIIQTGVKIVFVAESCVDIKPFWVESWSKTKGMFLEAGIDFTVVPGV